jgi:hypothetical protein
MSRENGLYGIELHHSVLEASKPLNNEVLKDYKQMIQADLKELKKQGIKPKIDQMKLVDFNIPAQEVSRFYKR